MKGMMKDKVTIVTGGASGIGRATALAFAREEAVVAVADIAVETGEETAHMIKQTGGEAIFIECNVARAVEVEAMVKKTVEVYGRLDCAFNNVGIMGPIIPIVDCPEDIWNQVISINLTGVWLCMKYEIPQMLKQRSGAIVNTASAAGLVGVPGLTPYTASKHGVVGLTKAVALEYAKSGIRINSVCPGTIKTAMYDRVIAKNPEWTKHIVESHPLGRIGVAEEVAEAAVWLCSDLASFVTGHALSVDGGATAG